MRNREAIIRKQLDFIQKRHLLSTLKGNLRSTFEALTKELNILRGIHR